MTVTIQAQASGHLEREAAARRSVNELVGRREAYRVEGKRRALHAGRGLRVGLERVVVGRADDQCAARAEVIDDGNAEGATFHRVGSGADLVKQHQRRQPQVAVHRRDVGDVPAEGAQARGDGLLVADVRKHRSEDRDGRARLGGNVKPRLRHQREQAGRLEGDRFAAGIGTGDEQRRLGRHQFDVDGFRRVRQPFEVVGIARHHALHQQRMPCRQQLEAAVAGERGRRGAGHLRQPRLGLQHVELGCDMLVARHLVAARAEAVGELEQDPKHLFGLFRFERDDLVVDLDGGERLEVERLPAGGAAVHETRQRRPMLGLHEQHETAVPLGDDLILQVFRRVAAAQVAVERLAQLRALPPEAIANRAERGARVIGHIAGGLDRLAHARDLVLEGSGLADQPLQPRQLARSPPHRARRGFHRLEIVGQREQPERFERAALDIEEREQRLQVFGRAQREDRVGREIRHRLRRRRQSLAHGADVSGRLQRVKAHRSRRRQREAAQGGDNTIEFEGPEAACGHVRAMGVRRPEGNRSF